MRKILLTTLISGLFFACGDDKSGKDLLPTDSSILDTTLVEDQVLGKKQLVVLYDKTTLWDQVQSPNKALKLLNFGRVLTQISDTTIGPKKYFRVSITEGDEGWVKAENVMEDAKTVVITQKAAVYTAADPLTLSEKNLEIGEFVVIGNQKKGDFYEFVTAQKKTKGYLKDFKNISDDTKNIEAAQKYNLIMKEQDIAKRKKALEEFALNSDYGSTPFGEAAKTAFLELSDTTLDEEAIEKQILEKAQGE